MSSFRIDDEEEDDEDEFGPATGSPMRTMKALFAIILPLTLGACTPKATIVAEPITPAVTEAKGRVQAVSAATVRTQQGAAETAKRVGAVGEGIEEALTHAEAMRARKPAGGQAEAEWRAQWALLSDIRTRNLFAEASANATLGQSKEARTLADSASKGMAGLETHAKATDRNTTKISTENTKLQQDAGTWRGIKQAAWTLIILGIIAVLIIWGLPLIRKTFVP